MIDLILVTLLVLVISNIFLVVIIHYMRRRQISTIEEQAPIFEAIHSNRVSLRLLESLLTRKRAEKEDNIYTFEFPELPIQNRIDWWAKKNAEQHDAIVEMLIDFKKSFIFGDADQVTIGITRKDIDNGKTDL